MNDLYFTAKNKKACRLNHFRRKCISSISQKVYIINFAEIAYHQVAEEYTFGDDIHAKA